MRPPSNRPGCRLTWSSPQRCLALFPGSVQEGLDGLVGPYVVNANNAAIRIAQVAAEGVGPSRAFDGQDENHRGQGVGAAGVLRFLGVFGVLDGDKRVAGGAPVGLRRTVRELAECAVQQIQPPPAGSLDPIARRGTRVGFDLASSFRS